MLAIKQKTPVPNTIVPFAKLYLFFFLSLNIIRSPIIVEIRKSIKKPIITIYIHYLLFLETFVQLNCSASLWRCVSNLYQLK